MQITQLIFFIAIQIFLEKASLANLNTRVFLDSRLRVLRLPKYCLGLSNNYLVSPTGLSKIVKEITF